MVDIAKLAGVAPMTVSRVINQSGYVSAKLREKVQRVIDKLEYHPNALARGLKSQRSHVIGILAPDIQNPYSAELAGSIQDVMLESGYTAFLSTTEQSSKRELAALAAFFDHRVAGIVVATVETEAGNEALDRFTRRGLPIVLVGRSSGPANIARVTADHWKGAYDAVEHLISLGHTRIGYIGGSPQTAGRLRRFHGYVRSHARARPGSPRRSDRRPRSRNRPWLLQTGRRIRRHGAPARAAAPPYGRLLAQRFHRHGRDERRARPRRFRAARDRYCRIR